MNPLNYHKIGGMGGLRLTWPKSPGAEIDGPRSPRAEIDGPREKVVPHVDNNIHFTRQRNEIKMAL